MTSEANPHSLAVPAERSLPSAPLTVSVIIPAYNEGRAIAGVIGELRDGLKTDGRGERFEIIVVDDGSADDTFEVASSLDVKVVRHDFNKGYGAALKSGVAAAGGDIVLFFDGDGQHHVDDALRLLEHFPDYDMVVGERTRGSHQPLSRRPGKKILSLFADSLAGTRIPDLNSGLRAFKKDILLKYIHLMPSGFSFSTTSTFAFLKSNRRIMYVPITATERIGKSSVKQFRHGTQTMMLMLHLVVLFAPLRVFLSASLGLFALALASLAIDVIGSSGVADVTVLLAISSLLVFFFGLLADQIAAMRREKHE